MIGEKDANVSAYCTLNLRQESLENKFRPPELIVSANILCRLLAREGRFWTTADGFHPAAAVIDEQRGVQHIFIYSGHPNGPAGVFRITRTLDTPKLAAMLNSNP